MGHMWAGSSTAPDPRCVPRHSLLEHSFGIQKHAHPQDVVKIPVSREVCDGKEPDRKQLLCTSLDRLLTVLGSLDPKMLHVKHHIKFSTLTPARLNVLESFATSERVSHNATEASIIHSHDSWRQTGASTSSSKLHFVGTYSSGRIWRSPRGRTSMAPPHPDRNRVSRMHAADVDARATSRLPPCVAREITKVDPLTSASLLSASRCSS